MSDKKTIHESLTLVQAEIIADPILKSANNPFFKSKYADISAILMSVVPKLNSHGLTLTQPTRMDGGNMIVDTVVTSSTGVEISGSILVTPAKTNDPQSVGSAITYARRYGLLSLLALPTTDDDGNSASQPQNGYSGNSEPNNAYSGSPGDYVCKVGKYKGQAIKDIVQHELVNYCTYISDKAKEDKKPLDGMMKELVDQARLYLKTKKVEK